MHNLTEKGSILSQEIFCSDLRRSGKDSGTAKKIKIKSNTATPVPVRTKQKGFEFNKKKLKFNLFTKCYYKIFTIKSR